MIATITIYPSNSLFKRNTNYASPKISLNFTFTFKALECVRCFNNFMAWENFDQDRKKK